MTRIRTSLFIAALISVLSVGIYAQDSPVVSSITPAHGSTNIALDSIVTITFSSPLDLTEFVLKDPETLPVDIAIFSGSLPLEPTNPTFSADSTALSFSVQFEADTRYTILILGAQAANGTVLKTPSYATFTTGATLPAGSITGNVSYNAAGNANALVAAVNVVLETDDAPSYFAVTDADGNYTVEFVEAGTYTVISLSDVNQDGEFDPNGGDAIGGYDPDNNGIVDPLILADGNVAANTNIEVKNPTPVTGNSLAGKITTSIKTSIPDADLVGILGQSPDATGTAVNWIYLFNSPGTQKQVTFFGNSAICFPLISFLGDLEVPEGLATPLPEGRIDTDAAMTTVLANDGNAFTQANPDFEVTITGISMDLAGLGGLLPGSTKTGQFQKSVSAAAGSAIAPKAIWMVLITAPDLDKPENFLGKSFIGAVDMVTGDYINILPNATTSSSNVQAATASIIQTVPDAVLVSVSAPTGFFVLENINPQGTASGWEYSYYSATTGKYYRVGTAGTTITPVLELQNALPYNKPLPATFLDSPQAVAAAEAAGGEALRTANPAIKIEATLAWGINPNSPDDLFWAVSYGTAGTQLADATTYYVAGITTGIENRNTQTPSGFDLSPAYPNPSSLATGFSIPFTLQSKSNVDIRIYNLLGQEVKRVHKGIMNAGAHTISRVSLRNNLAAGVYFIKLQVQEGKGIQHSFTQRIILQ